jgi:hypothetical protein
LSKENGKMVKNKSSGKCKMKIGTAFNSFFSAFLFLKKLTRIIKREKSGRESKRTE